VRSSVTSLHLIYKNNNGRNSRYGLIMVGRMNFRPELHEWHCATLRLPPTEIIVACPIRIQRHSYDAVLLRRFHNFFVVIFLFPDRWRRGRVSLRRHSGGRSACSFVVWDVGILPISYLFASPSGPQRTDAVNVSAVRCSAQYARLYGAQGGPKKVSCYQIISKMY